MQTFLHALGCYQEDFGLLEMGALPVYKVVLTIFRLLQVHHCRLRRNPYDQLSKAL